MLTHLTIHNFKRFENIEVELGNPVVFIGPNNSGKTTALQALAIWGIGLGRWREKRGNTSAPEKRPGVTINRRDLITVPVPEANLLWRNLHTRDIQRTNGKQETRNVRIEVIVQGVNKGREWNCGLEFDYANDESFYCRPLRTTNPDSAERMPIPSEAEDSIAFLPPMSGLADREFVKQPGETAFLIGQGRTAEVLRNLCYRISGEAPEHWETLVKTMESLFSVQLQLPRFLPERGEILMSYREHGVTLDLSSSGRGLQQTLLLLSYMYSNPSTVLLLDEPDAHLEILRQRQIYSTLTRTAEKLGSQIICASHSEVILNEASDKDVVIAFVGKPHRIDNRGKSQLMKSLKDIGSDVYYQAEERKWVLYLEGSTDLVILQELASLLNHPAAVYLEAPFVHYIETNLPGRAIDHFHGLKEAVPDLRAISLVDRIDKNIPDVPDMFIKSLFKREIENYICNRDVLLAWTKSEALLNGYDGLLVESWQKEMNNAIDEIERSLESLDKPTPWQGDLRVSDEFLKPLFKKFYNSIGLSNMMNKSNYHRLARFMRPEDISEEIVVFLNIIAKTASSITSEIEQ